MFVMHLSAAHQRYIGVLSRRKLFDLATREAFASCCGVNLARATAGPAGLRAWPEGVEILHRKFSTGYCAREFGYSNRRRRAESLPVHALLPSSRREPRESARSRRTRRPGGARFAFAVIEPKVRIYQGLKPSFFLDAFRTTEVMP